MCLLFLPFPSLGLELLQLKDVTEGRPSAQSSLATMQGILTDTLQEKVALFEELERLRHILERTRELNVSVTRTPPPLATCTR